MQASCRRRRFRVMLHFVSAFLVTLPLLVFFDTFGLVSAADATTANADDGDQGQDIALSIIGQPAAFGVEWEADTTFEDDYEGAATTASTTATAGSSTTSSSARRS